MKSRASMPFGVPFAADLTGIQGFRKMPDSIAAAGSCQIAIAVFIGRNPSLV